MVTKFVCYFECYFFLFLPFKIFIVAPLKSPLLIPYFAIIAFTSANADAADGLRAAPDRSDYEIDFGNVILNHLRTAGVQQAHKEDGIKFTSINPFPGRFISGDGRYDESENENASQKRAAIFIGPEYGTLGRADIVAAAREARDLQFDVLICCAFNYDAHSSEIDKLADLLILKARMNPDLHMADELKTQVQVICLSYLVSQTLTSLMLKVARYR